MQPVCRVRPASAGEDGFSADATACVVTLPMTGAAGDRQDRECRRAVGPAHVLPPLAWASTTLSETRSARRLLRWSPRPRWRPRCCAHVTACGGIGQRGSVRWSASVSQSQWRPQPERASSAGWDVATGRLPLGCRRDRRPVRRRYARPVIKSRPTSADCPCAAHAQRVRHVGHCNREANDRRARLARESAAFVPRQAGCQRSV